MSDSPRPRLQFSIRTLLEMVAVVAVIIAFLYVRPSANEYGRYQMLNTIPGPAAPNRLILLDNKTSKFWYKPLDASRTHKWLPYEPDAPDFTK
ncbi:MAG TPA: hypothetical protein VGJ26_04310 [Pirellulales bacterium]